MHNVHVVGMDKLKQYLSDTQTPQAAFAARVGVDQTTISRIARKRVAPSLELALRIKEATSGAVQPEDLLPAKTSGGAA